MMSLEMLNKLFIGTHGFDVVFVGLVLEHVWWAEERAVRFTMFSKTEFFVWKMFMIFDICRETFMIFIFYLLFVWYIWNSGIKYLQNFHWKIFSYLEDIAAVELPIMWDTSSLPFWLKIAIAPPICPSGKGKVLTPRTPAPTRIWAELLPLSRRTLAFLLREPRWLVSLTSRCQACTVSDEESDCYFVEPETIWYVPTFAAPDA